MLLIISEDKDQSTNQVIDWLIFLNKKFFRINDSEKLEHISLKLNNKGVFGILQLDIHRNVSLSEIDCYWYRRGNFKFDIKNVKRTFLLTQANSELKSLFNGLNCYLSSLPSLGNFQKEINFSKIESLIVASRNGLSIPETIISSSVTSFKDYMNDSSKLWITKSISDEFSYRFRTSTLCAGFPTLLKFDDIKPKSEWIFPSLVQAKIEKKYELRIVFLNGDFYSMAIFTKSQESSNIDYRRSNVRDMKVASYNLPDAIQEKLTRFMKELGLNFGSIDMIVTRNNEYVFLEVNPSGQFGWMSRKCNFNLERKIAEYFSKQCTNER